MFCTQCGKEIVSDGKYCSSCGALVLGIDENSDLVTFKLSELRVPYATADFNILPESEQDSELIRIPRDSELAQNANKPFNPHKVPPDEGDYVPLDCAWAFVEHPGPIPSNALSDFYNIKERFAAMGNLMGRKKWEIESVVGPPMVENRQLHGITAVWGKTGMFSIWQVGLQFDPYEVCLGIYSETNM